MNTGQLKAIWTQCKGRMLRLWGLAVGDRAAIREGEREQILGAVEAGFAISRRQEMDELRAFLSRTPSPHRR
jgi:uncharacterized protein YjbJ (UPF0337 family)